MKHDDIIRSYKSGTWLLYIVMYVIFYITDEVIFSVPVQIYCDENSPEAKSKLHPEIVPNRPVPIVDDNITIRVPRYIFTFCFLYVHGVLDILHLKFQTCVIFQYQSFFILVNILSASKCARSKLLHQWFANNVLVYMFF